MRQVAHTLLPVLFVLALPLLVMPTLGCGGGGSEADAPAGPVTEGGFVPSFRGPDRRIDADIPGAHDSENVQICCAGRSVYAVWEDHRNGDPDIFFNRSLDGGATWMATDVRLNSDPAGANASRMPQICCDGARVYVTWYCHRDGNPDIYCNASADGGETWLLTDRRLDTDVAGAASSYNPEICCAGDSVYVAWEDFRVGGGGLRFNRSLDGGASWMGADVRIDRTPVGVSARTFSHQMCCDGTNVRVIWLDRRGGTDRIRFNQSINGGATWFVFEQVLDVDGIGIVPSASPQICCSGDRVYAVWAEGVAGHRDIQFSVSDDGGRTWLLAPQRVDTDTAWADDSILPQIACDGDAVYVVWDDRRDFVDVRFNRSLDGGMTWLADDMRLNTDARLQPPAPQVACSGETVYVAWSTGRAGDQDVWFDYSTDGGLTWQAPDLRLDTDPAINRSRRHDLCADGFNVFVAWEDDRDGGSDIYVRASPR